MQMSDSDSLRADYYVVGTNLEVKNELLTKPLQALKVQSKVLSALPADLSAPPNGLSALPNDLSALPQKLHERLVKFLSRL